MLWACFFTQLSGISGVSDCLLFISLLFFDGFHLFAPSTSTVRVLKYSGARGGQFIGPFPPLESVLGSPAAPPWSVCPLGLSHGCVLAPLSGACLLGARSHPGLAPGERLSEKGRMGSTSFEVVRSWQHLVPPPLSAGRRALGWEPSSLGNVKSLPKLCACPPLEGFVVLCRGERCGLGRPCDLEPSGPHSGKCPYVSFFDSPHLTFSVLSF